MKRGRANGEEPDLSMMLESASLTQNGGCRFAIGSHGLRENATTTPEVADTSFKRRGGEGYVSRDSSAQTIPQRSPSDSCCSPADSDSFCSTSGPRTDTWQSRRAWSTHYREESPMIDGAAGPCSWAVGIGAMGGSQRSTPAAPPPPPKCEKRTVPATPTGHMGDNLPVIPAVPRSTDVPIMGIVAASGNQRVSCLSGLSALAAAGRRRP